jgi:hypothetical protein
MSAGKNIKREQAKIEEIESKALPFNENKYQDIANTLVKPSKIQLPKKKEYIEISFFTTKISTKGCCWMPELAKPPNPSQLI